MKKALFIFFIFIQGLALAQVKDSIKFKRFAVGIAYSTDLSGSNSIRLPAISGTFLYPFTSGANFVYVLNKHVALETGIFWANKTTNALQWYVPEASKGPPVTSDHTRTAYAFIKQLNTFNSYQYLDIPTKFNFYLTTRKLKFYLFFGFSNNFFLYQKIVNIQDHTKTITTGKPASVPLFNLSALGGFGFSFNISKQLYIKFEPTCRQALTSINDPNLNYKHFFYSFGINSGIYFKW